MTPLNVWQRYIETLIWRKGSLDESTYTAALRAGDLHIERETVFNECAKRITAAGDVPRESKLRNQICRAYVFVGEHAGDFPITPLPKPPKPTYAPEKLERLAKQLGFDVTQEWLAQRSPITTPSRSPAGVLHKLFLPREQVLVFDAYRSQGCELWTHPGLAGNLSILNHLGRGCREGVWFLCNPVDGAWRDIDRLKSEFNPTGHSRRCEECVTAWRYAVLESDKAPKQLWLNFLVQLPLPIACITDSAGASIHAVIRIDAQNKPQWDEIVRKRIGPALIPFGVDSGALTAVRLTRLPNCRREEKGRRQELLYLNPNPDYTPICHKPRRDDTFPEWTKGRFKNVRAKEPQEEVYGVES